MEKLMKGDREGTVYTEQGQELLRGSWDWNEEQAGKRSCRLDLQYLGGVREPAAETEGIYIGLMRLMEAAHVQTGISDFTVSRSSLQRMVPGRSGTGVSAAAEIASIADKALGMAGFVYNKEAREYCVINHRPAPGLYHCPACGCLLERRTLTGEGSIPYCRRCGEYRFPMYSTAVSMEIFDPSGEKTLLIQQYGRKRRILVAGYINRGEAAEEALIREAREEVGLEITEYQFNASRFFPGSNTLMMNFACITNDDKLSIRPDEVDQASWLSLEEAREKIYRGSLAEQFLLEALDKKLHVKLRDEKGRTGSRKGADVQ